MKLKYKTPWDKLPVDQRIAIKAECIQRNNSAEMARIERALDACLPRKKTRPDTMAKLRAYILKKRKP